MSVGVSNVPEINLYGSVNPKEFVSPAIATIKMHNEGVEDVGLPSKNFTFSLRKLREDSKTGDCFVYMSTGAEADAHDIFESILIRLGAKIKAMETTLKNTNNRVLRDSALESIDALTIERRDVQKQLKQFIVGGQNKIVSATDIIVAIRDRCFDFKELKLLMKK